MIAENTRAVLNNLLLDIKKIWFITLCVMQTIFIVFYVYSICTSIDRVIFFVAYCCLFLLSIIAFTVFLKKHKNDEKQSAKFNRAKNFIKYFINAIMIIVNIVELLTVGIGDFNKVILIISIVSLIVQLIIEFIQIFADRYIRDFCYAFDKDIGFLNPGNIGSNVLKLIDAPLEKWSNKKEGIVVELTEQEKRLLEYKAKHKESIDKKEKNK